MRAFFVFILILPLCAALNAQAQQAPVYIMPFDGDSISGASAPVFSWAPCMGPDGIAKPLTFKLYRIIEGQSAMSAAQANPAIFVENNLNTTVMAYPQYAPKLSTGMYCWQIEWSGSSVFGDKALPVNNPGEVWSFYFNDDNPACKASFSTVKDGKLFLPDSRLMLNIVTPSATSQLYTEKITCRILDGSMKQVSEFFLPVRDVPLFPFHIKDYLKPAHLRKKGSIYYLCVKPEGEQVRYIRFAV
ncbi:MAG: hypothetical protein V4543_15175 [Bacteroidota bacterium]